MADHTSWTNVTANKTENQIHFIFGKNGDSYAASLTSDTGDILFNPTRQSIMARGVEFGAGVYSKDEHYAPTKDNSATKTVTSGDVAFGTNYVITGVETDGKGHITGVTGGKLPAANNYSLPSASTGALGGVKVANAKSTAVTTSTTYDTDGRYYGLQIDSAGKAYVNIPWTDTDTKVTSAANHYEPTKDANATKTVTSGDVAFNSSFVITGVETDGKGHITGVTGGKLPAANDYSLPTASASVKGGIKVGTHLSVTNEVMSVTTTDTVSAGGTGIPTAGAVQSAINSALTSALIYKGTIGTTGATVTSLPASHKVGDVYVVATAGTYAGQACEVGDYIICKTAGTTANNAHWDVVNGENQVTDNNPTLSWGTQATVATVDGTALHVTLPANPNTDNTSLTNGTTKCTKTSANGLSLTGGTNKFTVSDGTNSFDVDITPSIANNVTGSGLTADTFIFGSGTSGIKTSGISLKSTNSVGTIGSGKVYAVGKDANNQLAVSVPWENTHYTSHLYVTTSTGTANASTANDTTYLRLFDDTTARESVKITGAGGTSVAAAGGTITITSTAYTGDKGITVSNGQIGHSQNAITAKTSYATTTTSDSLSSEVNGTGGTFKVTDVKYDAYGHITASQDRTVTVNATMCWYDIQ